MAAFRQLFHLYHEKLHRYAFTIVKDNDASEDIVQVVFLNLWEKKDRLLGEEKIGSYLYKSIYNLSLNHIRNKKTKLKNTKDASRIGDHLVQNAADRTIANDLSTGIRQVLNSLPTQCRIIFLKSREDGKKYAEIAAELGISVKTVEAQIGKALKIFRKQLQDYL